MIRSTALLLTAAVTPFLAAHPLASQTSAKPATPSEALTVAAIYGHGSLLENTPGALTWSPDGKHLSYMEKGQLLDLDPATGKTHVLISRAQLDSFLAAEATETEGDHRARYKMASYFWSPDSARLLFDKNGRLWLYDLQKGTGTELPAAGMAAGADPKFSPDGEFVSFIRHHGLAVARLRDPGNPTAMVAPAPAPEEHVTLLNGEVDWVYEEELDTRSNYFWSPDSKRLAYLQMDETAVPEYPITDWLPTHATVTYQRYPQAGDPNPAVRVGVISARGGETVWVKLPMRAGEDYIPRFGWVDAKTLWIETLTRDQKHRGIYFADAATGQSREMLQLNDSKFFENNYDVFVKDGHLVLTHWGDGHTHLYLYRYGQTGPAQLARQLTKGDFEVSEVLRVDPAKQMIDYASSEGNPLERQLWQVNFNGKRKQLSTGAGFHDGDFAPGGDAFIEVQSTRTTPPAVKFCREAAECRVLWQARIPARYHLRAPEQLTVKAHDGTLLYGTLLLPEGKGPASVPLIVNPYGGPGAPSVLNRWSDSLFFDELLAQHGFAVLHADNRGMGGRGRAFIQAAYHCFGPVQLEDQLTVVDAALAAYPQLDPRRLGWWGWSWGGSFTLYALTHSERFRAGVAVAPVTAWRNYDSTYTERYLGLPAESATQYHDFSAINSAAHLKGHLLLAHGTGDDNVHLENTVQLTQKLIEAGIPYDLQIYPRKLHSIAGPDVRTHLFNRILAHFEQYLKPDGKQ